jgi:hypothetical protein
MKQAVVLSSFHAAGNVAQPLSLFGFAFFAKNLARRWIHEMESPTRCTGDLLPGVLSHHFLSAEALNGLGGIWATKKKKRHWGRHAIPSGASTILSAATTSSAGNCPRAAAEVTAATRCHVGFARYGAGRRF